MSLLNAPCIATYILQQQQVHAWFSKAVINQLCSLAQPNPIKSLLLCSLQLLVLILSIAKYYNDQVRNTAFASLNVINSSLCLLEVYQGP